MRSARGERSRTGRSGCSSRTGREARPVLDWTGRWGRYPGAVALFSFVALELANPRPAYPRTLAIATALYSYWALAGMAIYGREAWTRNGEGFAVAFELLSRIAPVRGARREDRRPLAVHRPRWRRAGARHPRLRGRPPRVDELRRLLEDVDVAEPHREHPGGSRRLATANGRSRDDADERVRAGALRSRRRVDVSRGGARPLARSPGRGGHSSPTSSSRSSRSPPRISSPTTSRCS